MTVFRPVRSLRGLLRCAARDLWNRLVFYGMLHALGDPYAAACVATWERPLDEPPPGHPERLTGLPLTALELRLVREMSEVGAEGDGPDLDRYR
ncbi:hypothetical protein ABIA32_005993 [Streptacidiphilus sp. MAP12-20]|uniref:DUF6059 family protein n=1 Tax=Streptacidiphilus sp. MAP12-20 TaxID=3156299 RepID=UPI003515A22F